MRISRNFILAVVALLAMTAAHAAHADGANALSRFYEEVDSLSAHFEQTQYAADGTEMRHSSGLFLLSRPGRFRWEYQKPYRQIMVSNGQVFKFYDVGLAQVTIRPVTQTLRATPAQLLTGGIALDKAFVVQSGGKRDGLDWLQLVPRADNSDFKEIRLGLRDGLPVAMELDDRLGQTTKIHFSDIKVNPPLDAARFELDVPAGVTIVDARKQAR